MNFVKIHKITNEILNNMDFCNMQKISNRYEEIYLYDTEKLWFSIKQNDCLNGKINYTLAIVNNNKVLKNAPKNCIFCGHCAKIIFNHFKKTK